MSGLAGIIHWDGKPIEATHMDLMMHMIQHRGPDGLRWEANGSVALGHALLTLKKGEERQQQPVWLPDQSCAIVADARIYNRDELLRRLGEVSWFDDDPSDAALLLAAYERWGVDCLDLLDGDFAFAIWDGDKNHLFAAKDPFGVKPFFYRWEKERFLFGSEPKQMLILPDVPVEPDDLIVGEFLFLKFKKPERTFFKEIRRLIPANYLIATPESINQIRYWNPDPQREIYYKDSQEYFDQFRELLKKSIANRLDTDFPIGAHLSGGFDSSSIVVMAAEIYKSNNDHLPQFETISAVFGDLSCDETPYIDAVHKISPFYGHTYSPLEEEIYVEDLLELLWWRDSPFGTTQPGFFNGCFRTLSKMGARLLLDGAGGDEVASEDDYLRDLAIQRKFGRLFYESFLASRYTWHSFFCLLNESLRELVPESAKSIYRTIRKPVINYPGWLQPDFIDFHLQNISTISDDILKFKSLTQTLVYKGFTSPLFQLGIEGIESEGAYHFYVSSHPYCDRKLVEFTLAIPYKYRLPRGQWRFLQRRSFAQRLPSLILERRRYTQYNSYAALTLGNLLPKLVDQLFSTDTWFSEKYVDRKHATLLFSNFSVEDAEVNFSGVTAPILIIFYLEMWLRQFERYKAY